MHIDLTPIEQRELYNRLRQLADAEGAVLAAWRDVQSYCESKGRILVPQASMGPWQIIPGYAIKALMFLASIDGSDDNFKPQYWVDFEQYCTDLTNEHLTRSKVTILPR